MAQLDPTLIINSPRPEQMDYAKTLGTIGLLKGQQQEQAYRAAQLQHQQLADVATQRKQATLQTVGGLAAGGDTEGAQKAALAAGSFDILEQLQKMDDTARERLAKVSASTAPILAQLKQIPRGPAREQAFQQAAPMLAQAGLDPQHLQGVAQNLNDDNFLDLAVTNGMKITDYNTMIKQRQDHELDTQKFAHTVSNDAAQIATQRRGQDITLRGQDLTNARARDAVAQMGKAPAGYRWGNDGNLAAIPGGPADKKDKPLTEDQGKATGYYRVMRQAAETLNGVKGYNPTIIANALDKGDLTGTEMSQIDRRALNAQRAFVVAALRAESGATYGPGEVVDKVRTLFPVPGDGPDVLADKAALRQQFLKSVRDRAGPGLDGVAPLGAGHPVKNGSLVKGADGVTEWRPHGR